MSAGEDFELSLRVGIQTLEKTTKTAEILSKG